MPNVLEFEAQLCRLPQTGPGEKARFRSEFQRFVLRSLRSGGRLEEVFGIAWERATDEVSVSEASQSELFEELIRWAKSRS